MKALRKTALLTITVVLIGSSVGLAGKFVYDGPNAQDVQKLLIYARVNGVDYKFPPTSESKDFIIPEIETQNQRDTHIAAAVLFA